MTTELAHSQGSVWQGISLTAETRRRMLTRIMTVEMEKRQMSRLEMMFPSLTPPRSSDEVLRYLQDKALKFGVAAIEYNEDNNKQIKATDFASAVVFCIFVGCKYRTDQIMSPR